MVPSHAVAHTYLALQYTHLSFKLRLPCLGDGFLTTNADATMFVIVGLGYIGDRHFVDASLVVRLERDTIVIEHDVNNKPLVEALLAAGIPRDHIVLAYAGESTDAAA